MSNNLEAMVQTQIEAAYVAYKPPPKPEQPPL